MGIIAKFFRGGPPEKATRLSESSGKATVRARYDAAQTTSDNRKHWQAADELSANASNVQIIRRTLRSRSRYEAANNAYASGIADTLANDTVGTGPSLQVRTKDKEFNGALEDAFSQWAEGIRLATKLRLMRRTKIIDGEAFGLFVTNERPDVTVSLDIRLIECDRVTDISASFTESTGDGVDGIEYDAHGNPTSYSILRQHPGGPVAGMGMVADQVPAAQVLHYFTPTRAEQCRGIPELTPSLGLFAQLRRYTVAVLDAAELAADFAGVIYTTSPAGGEARPVVPMDTVELERKMLTTLPDGWQIGQIDAKQPTTTYADFKREILNEIARSISMPYNVAAGNSSDYNYASGRLDFQTYFRSIKVEQANMESVLLDRILAAWIAEAVKAIPDLAAKYAAATAAGPLPHAWFWDGTEHVDPLKEANAQAARLANNTTTLAAEYARQGKDWEEEIQQRGVEVALIKKLGLMPPPPVGPGGQTPPTDRTQPEDAPPGDKRPSDGQPTTDTKEAPK